MVGLVPCLLNATMGFMNTSNRPLTNGIYSSLNTGSSPISWIVSWMEQLTWIQTGHLKISDHLLEHKQEHTALALQNSPELVVAVVVAVEAAVEAMERSVNQSRHL